LASKSREIGSEVVGGRIYPIVVASSQRLNPIRSYCEAIHSENLVMSRVALPIRIFISLITFVVIGAAQTNTADLIGQVTDPNRSSVPKARVSIKNQATGIECAAAL
jgi:hypothetical protein